MAKHGEHQSTTKGTPLADTYLIADDDEFFRTALKTILMRLGAREVIETGSLEDALMELSRVGSVRLALFDLDMPGMDGAASLRRVRERFPDAGVAVVSASAKKSHVLRALEAGACGYIPKGLGVTEVTRALELIMGGLIYVPSLITTLTQPQDQPVPRQAESTSSEAQAEAEAPGPQLTPRQWDVLTLLVQGLSNKEIARALELGEGTVKVHVAAMFRTLGVTSRSAAAAVGARLLDQRQHNPSAAIATRLSASRHA
jgi:DNA-binding NarL/FixJ family response regulator